MMKAPNVTAGEWTVISHPNGWTIQNKVSGGGECVAQQYADSSEANAKMLAASKKLAEALNAIISDLPSNRDWLDPVIEAMAKDALKSAGYTDSGTTTKE